MDEYQIVMANSSLTKKQDQFHHLFEFHNLEDIKSLLIPGVSHSLFDIICDFYFDHMYLNFYNENIKIIIPDLPNH